MNSEIVIVSGLPRSGTSLMMQLLTAGGIEPVTDNIRTADTDNPHGYYEFERAKKIKRDASWLPECRGKVVKMISQLLYDLPPTERYRIVFMERDLDEVLESQEKMLRRLNQSTSPRDEMTHAFTQHLTRLNKWLAEQTNMLVLRVRYVDVMSKPADELARLGDFLAGRLNLTAAATTIDQSLYRNRKA
jgi:hypothetical protein